MKKNPIEDTIANLDSLLSELGIQERGLFDVALMRLVTSRKSLLKYSKPPEGSAVPAFDKTWLAAIRCHLTMAVTLHREIETKFSKPSEASHSIVEQTEAQLVEKAERHIAVGKVSDQALAAFNRCVALLDRQSGMWFTQTETGLRLGSVLQILEWLMLAVDGYSPAPLAESGYLLAKDVPPNRYVKHTESIQGKKLSGEQRLRAIDALRTARKRAARKRAKRQTLAAGKLERAQQSLASAIRNYEAAQASVVTAPAVATAPVDKKPRKPNPKVKIPPAKVPLRAPGQEKRPRARKASQ